MQIVFDLPHVFKPGSSPEENAYALRALLECLASIDLAYLRSNAAPLIYQSGVVYGRTKIWDPVPAIIARGYGDCKSLTAWRIAELRKNGEMVNPVFRWIKRPDGSGATDFHILVLRADGTFEDPSKILGMGVNENGPIINRG